MSVEEDRKVIVHVASFCVRRHGGELEVLILKRTSQRRLYPNLWEGGGGQVSPGEGFKGAVRRQVEEETGLGVEVIMAFDDYQIEAPFLDQKLIPGIKFICHVPEMSVGMRSKEESSRYDEEPKVKISEREHTEFRWVTLKEVNLGKIEFIPGIDKEIKKVFALIDRLELF